jgi:hypothetical protein
MVRQDFVDPCLPACIQRCIYAAELFGQFGGFGFGGRKIGLPQGHAAADVVADERGIKAADAEKCCPHGIAASGMQVGHSGHTQHLRQFGGGFELLDGSPLYPCVGIGDDGNVVV